MVRIVHLNKSDKQETISLSLLPSALENPNQRIQRQGLFIILVAGHTFCHGHIQVYSHSGILYPGQCSSRSHHSRGGHSDIRSPWDTCQRPRGGSHWTCPTSPQLNLAKVKGHTSDDIYIFLTHLMYI